MLPLILVVIGTLFLSCKDNDRKPPPTVGIERSVVPIYAYPLGNEQIYEELKKRIPRKEVMLIMNPNSGVGSNRDTNVYNTFLQLSRNGYRIFGYVSTNYGNRPASDIKGEIDRYMTLYDFISGVFLDEVNSDPSNLPYYDDICAYAKGRGLRVIYNVGANSSDDFLTCPNHSIMSEEDYLHYMGLSMGRYSQMDKVCVLIYGVTEESQYSQLMEKLGREGIRCAYITHEGGTQNLPTWFVLSRWLDRIMN